MKAFPYCSRQFSTRPGKRIRYWGVLLFLTSMLSYGQSGLWSTVTAHHKQQSYPLILFTLPAQPLPQALTALAQRTGQTILIADDLSTLTAKPVQGFFTANKALRMMLTGQPVAVSWKKNNVVVIKLDPESVNEPEQWHPLPEQTRVPEPQELAEVIVQGMQLLGNDGHAVKYQNAHLSEVFSIQQLSYQPSLNLTETLSAVPGVAISKDSGEGRHVYLRGLHSSLNQTRINGVPALFVTDSAVDQRGGAARTRSFDFNMLDPELFAQVHIHKSYTAQLDEGGIAGTIDLISRKPFDNGDNDWHGALQFQSHSNSRLSGSTPSASGYLSKRSDTLGLLVAMNYTEIDSIETGSHVWHWTRANFTSDNVADSVAADVAGALIHAQGDERLFVPVGNSLSAWANRRQRLALSSALQWQLTPLHLLEIDGLVGQMNNDRNHYQLATAGTNGLIGDVSGKQKLIAAQSNEQALLYAEFSQIDLRSEHQKQQTKTDFYQGTVRVNSQWTEGFSSVVTLGQSNSEFRSPVNDKLFLESSGQQVTLDWRSGTLRSQYDLDLTSPQQWHLMRSDVREDEFNNRFDVVNIDVSWQRSALTKFDFGIQIKQHSSQGVERRSRVDWLEQPLQPKVSMHTTQLPIQQDFIIAQQDASFLSIESTGLQSRQLNERDNRVGTDYQINEDTHAFYGHYQFGEEREQTSWQGSIGARYISTEQIISGGENLITATDNPDFVQTYIGWLPTLNASITWRDTWVARVAVSRNLARPNIDELRPTAEIDVADLSIRQGNPELKFYTADAIDLALEYYDPSTRASLTLFHKRLHQPIFQQSTNITYRASGLPLHYLAEDSRRSPESEFTLLQSINGGHSRVRGLEIALDTRLPYPMKNWRLAGHATLLSGEASLRKNGQMITIDPTGLSKWSYQVSLYYQAAQWGMSLSSRYRDGFVNQIGQTQNQVEGFAATKFVDARAFYDISDRLQLSVEAHNLTDEPLRQFQDQRTLVTVNNGRTYSLGLNYTF